VVTLFRAVLLLSVVAALACGDSGSSTQDGAPPDLLAQEGLTFPDLGGSSVDADASHAPVDGPHADLPDGASQPPDANPPDLMPWPDATPWPDTMPWPDLTPPKCSVFSDFSCVPGGSFFVRCSSTCTGGGNAYSIVCLSTTCACAKNGVNTASPNPSGSGCSACQAALGACNF
jgi:hypothetical protein